MTNRLRFLSELFRGARGVGRELLLAAASLLVGVFVVPCLIFVVGRYVLGAYANGSMLALGRDFFSGLATHSEACWFIALGPYFLLWLLRGGWKLLHNQPFAGGFRHYVTVFTRCNAA